MDSADHSSPRIPEEEITHLLLTLTDAFHLGANGDPRRGYLKVLGGLVRMGQLTQDQSAWAQDLHAHWNRALKEYLQRHPGVDLSDRLLASLPRDERARTELR